MSPSPKGEDVGYTTTIDALHMADANLLPLRLKRDRGIYALVEGPLIIGNRTSPAGWIRVGIGDPVVQRISGYFGTGLVASGLFPSRQENQAGVSINVANVEDPNQPLDYTPSRRAESAMELTNKFQLRDWFAVQPDIQYIIRPNGDPGVRNALVLGFRCNVALTRNAVRMVSSGS